MIASGNAVRSVIPGSMFGRGDSKPGRNLQLDLLRCGAILGVLVAHTYIFRPPKWWWDRLLGHPSWTGVDLFFVISGFLISGLLFSEFQRRGRINFGRFAIRRALKLYPTLYALVFGVMFVCLMHNGFHAAGWILSPAFHDVFLPPKLFARYVSSLLVACG